MLAMESSLCLYKEKLKEALVLVPTMSSDKKIEAVTYWNHLAEQLQDIVHKSGSDDYDLNQNINVSVEEHTGTVYASSTECGDTTSIGTIHCEPIVLTSLSSTTSSESSMVTPVIKQTTLNQFHQENLIEGKTIFEPTYLGETSVTTVEDCKDQLSNLLDGDKICPDSINNIPSSLSSTYVAIAQPDIGCSTGSSSLNTISCSSASDSAGIQSSDRYTVIKHPNLLTQVPNDHISVSNKPIVDLTGNMSDELYCSNVDEAQVNIGTHILNYLNTDGTTTSLANATINKPLSSSSIATDGNFDNVLMSSSLTCPRTTANMTHEIGNGQFDRGPKVFDSSHGFSQFEPSAQPLAINTTVNSSVFEPSNSHRDEMFTHSERPLQQIQLFNPNNGGDYVNNSYVFMNNRVKYMFCNTCHEQLEYLKDLEKHEHLHAHEKLQQAHSSGDQHKSIDPPQQNADGKKELVDSNKSDSDKVVANNNQHTCEVCGKSGFSTKGNLKRHLRAHSGEKPFKCEYCESCFTEKKSLKIHVRRHTGEKPYKCEICGKLFSQTGVLQSHMALHLNERNFDCQKCGKAFRQRSQLKLHLMRHDGVKRLECSTCMAKFLTKGDLERHCRIHTGERPYACKICNKTFTRQQSLNEHMNRHTGRKPYDCKYCEKTFSEMSACYKHAKTHKRQDQAQRQAAFLDQSGS